MAGQVRIIAGGAQGAPHPRAPGAGGPPDERDGPRGRLRLAGPHRRPVVLDLFAGTGALGLEALSRGAAAATFVESDRRVAEVLRANIRALDYEARTVVLAMDYRRASPDSERLRSPLRRRPSGWRGRAATRVASICSLSTLPIECCPTSGSTRAGARLALLTPEAAWSSSRAARLAGRRWGRYRLRSAAMATPSSPWSRGGEGHSREDRCSAPAPTTR